jgi:adenylyltransferase/sulfurtransferase
MKGQEKIRQARVAIVGCGGLGCPVLLYLSAAGVGNIGITDFDEVSISNLPRQILFGNNDIGKKKVDVAESKIKALHPEINIVKHDAMLDEKNAEEILKQYDFVIDGCDNFMTRYVVNDVCVKIEKPLVYGSILGFEGQLATFNYRGSKNLRDLFPEPPDADDVPDCSENGVLATVTGIMGTMMANECIKLILGKNISSDKLILINCLDLKMSVLNY